MEASSRGVGPDEQSEERGVQRKVVLACWGIWGVCGDGDGEDWVEAARRRGGEHSVWLTHGRRRRNICGITTDGSKEMRRGGKPRRRRGMMQAVAWLVAIACHITIVKTQTNSTTTTTTTTPVPSATNSSNKTNATSSVVIVRTTPAPT
jgi:hypothetical protein